jgi:hypothetical protein
MKSAALALFCLLAAIVIQAQTAKQHVNLGMSIEEFVARYDLWRTDTPETLAASIAAHEAAMGRHVSIQLDVEGRKTRYLFDKGSLCEIEITAGNTFAHELQVLTAQLGTSQISDADRAVWDRKDGTRFTLASREGMGVLLIAPTPAVTR